MCWSEKCCFCVRLDLGCMVIGSISLILSIILTYTTAVFLAGEAEADHLQNHYTMYQLLGVLHLDVNRASKEVIFGIILFVSFSWKVSSVVLILGVKLNKSGFVLSYFVFGIFFTFFLNLSALLLLLQSAWFIAFLLFGASLIQVHFLVVVHTFYELQVRGKIFIETTAANDDELLIRSSV